MLYIQTAIIIFLIELIFSPDISSCKCDEKKTYFTGKIIFTKIGWKVQIWPLTRKI